ncbi:MAG: methylenetetrahydrofolate--tRNA-(uracil(54)-C(5))-methyltransferase (FADH(2)-oxidizing) TrmFO [Ruminococcaceae bacterium]|nr:methylenetetrahydrofolate--tRNA-(uracil(54)-C(5))-methyltransferase (FADH(2)-oxidizing) TrmFO [Oscillospiraceae bacterium]
MTPKIKVIGAGLAGCEAAYVASRLGVSVDLYEMKPTKYTPAHKYDGFAELVCSNSLRSNQVYNAVGLLKEELSLLGSLVMEAAYATAVPAGTALAVDRVRFSDYITEKITQNQMITVHTGVEVTEIPRDGVTVVASGPLTDGALAEDILRLIGRDTLHFYDAAAPIIDAASIDFEKAYFASRYGKGESDDYVNCPMSKEEYELFFDALVHAEEAKLHEFDAPDGKEPRVFEGCMPVEVMARRGVETLLFGPLKPVGLPDPKTGREPYAVVQLRAENREKTMYNLVGFQTHLTFPEQRRVFRMIPGLENAEFLRYGVMHRNTYLCSPGLLSETYSLADKENIFFAGQMTGVEGYVESTGSGFVAGVSAARLALGLDRFSFPPVTMLGAMANYVSVGSTTDFQPMNANFGIIAPLDKKVKGGKAARNDAYAARSLACVKELKSFLFENQKENV